MARSRSSDGGFSLLETLVAVGLLTTMAIGVAQLFASATTASIRAQGATSTTLLATQKLEQLRGLTWGFGDESELWRPLTDDSTNLANEPPTDDGAGLRPSPTGTLHVSTPGYVDYLDGTGRWLGTGATPPDNTAYVRRWSVLPLPANPRDTVVLQVRVVSLTTDLRVGSTPGGGRLGDETWLTSVKTRKSP